MITLLTHARYLIFIYCFLNNDQVIKKCWLGYICWFVHVRPLVLGGGVGCIETKLPGPPPHLA